MQNGLFLVRTKDSSKGAYVLSMVLMTQPIHHLLEKSDSGVYLVNGQPFGSFTQVADLIKSMRSPSFVAPAADARSTHILQGVLDTAADQAHHTKHGQRHA